MSKLRCDCGYIISDIEVPNEVTGDLFSDKSKAVFFDFTQEILEEFLQNSGENNYQTLREKYFGEIYPSDSLVSEMIHDILYSAFLDLSLATLECDNCGRIHIQKEIGENQYLSFMPNNHADDPNYHKTHCFNYDRRSIFAKRPKPYYDE